MLIEACLGLRPIKVTNGRRGAFIKEYIKILRLAYRGTIFGQNLLLVLLQDLKLAIWYDWCG